MKGYTSTCSIFNLKDNGISFIRREAYLDILLNTDKKLLVVAPKEFMTSNMVKNIQSNVEFLWVDRVIIDYTFFKIHNEMYADFTPPECIIGRNCIIHETAVMDVDGIKLANCPNGSKIKFKHTGNIIIEDDVEIGPLCVIHRATMDSTIIRKGVRIGSKVNVGHNAIIGENTVIASGAILAGSNYGRHCWIGLNSVINQGLTICDNVVIGSGAVVIKDIIKSGIYVGNPARYLKPVEKGWNF